jgi:hypothetical protein
VLLLQEAGGMATGTFLTLLDVAKKAIIASSKLPEDQGVETFSE